MKRSAARIGIAAALLISLAATPAVAAPGSYQLKAGHVTRFHLPGADGYRLNVSSNARRYFTLTTRKGGFETRYSTRGRRTGTFGIRAGLAGLGRVDVRFKPSGRRHRLEPYTYCDGEGPTVQLGVVRGTVRFRGEEGYTNAAARHARAEVITWPSQRCRYLEVRPNERAKGLTADFTALSGVGEFSARRYSPEYRSRSRQVVFLAGTGSTRGRLSVFRSVRAVSDPSSFRLPEGRSNPEHVVLEPPLPFLGVGTFQRTPESVYTWEGTLSVAFPGLSEPVRLAGPQFFTSYCALRGCISQSGSDGPF